ncbi:hypothetical protein DFJ68_2126 [Terracoccus luteus]|uniref:Uncharacterized protein n=1 Tax=Terracoccus luteus TaxID=53356 RepID=A0A495XWM6_9MICO|nr:hypothetical protein DFJ68_2126 [Terracoccus luteus]
MRGRSLRRYTGESCEVGVRLGHSLEVTDDVQTHKGEVFGLALPLDVLAHEAPQILDR